MANLNSIFYGDLFKDSFTVLYWDKSDGSSFIEIHEDEGVNYYLVYWVPEFGGKALLDSQCNTFREAMLQLQQVSM